MSDNEIAKQSQGFPSINVHAEHEGVAIGYTDSVNTTLNVVLVDGKKSPLSKDYYALLMGYDPFEKDYVLVSKDRALTEYIQNDVKAKFSDLTPEAITAIKEIPAVISCEADGTESQQAVFAFIKDIRIQENGIKVYFQKYFPFPYSVLRTYQQELALHLFEYTRTHWTIKNVDLIEVLQDAGVFPGM